MTVNYLPEDYKIEGIRNTFGKFGGLNFMKKSRMFHLDRPMPIKRWNPGRGCSHHCYGDKCWASLFSKRLKFDFSEPELIESRLAQRFGDAVVFVWSLGDMFCSAVSDSWISRIIEAMRQSPRATFFLETKNPARYSDFLGFLPENTIISTTIETNRDYQVSKAPWVGDRYSAMRSYLWPHKHISIEPIMDFDYPILLEWIRDLNPEIVSVGYDNYKCGLPEPPLDKTMALIDQLERFTKVERKTLREKRGG